MAVLITTAAATSLRGGNRHVLRTSTGKLYAVFFISGQMNVWKSTDNGATWAEQDVGGTPGPPDANTLLSLSAAIDGNDIIHIFYADVASMGASIKYVLFHTADAPSNQDTFGAFEVGPASSPNSSVQTAIAVDSNNIPHGVWSEDVTNMGTSYGTIFYSNRIGGSWKSKVEVEGASSQVVCTNPEIVISGTGAPRVFYLRSSNTLRGALGNANNAASWTLHSIDTSIANYRPSAVFDSSGNEWVAYVKSSNLHLIRHPAANGWTSWDSPLTDSKGVATFTGAAADNHVSATAVDGDIHVVFIESVNDRPTHQKYDGSWSAVDELDTNAVTLVSAILNQYGTGIDVLSRRSDGTVYWHGITLAAPGDDVAANFCGEGCFTGQIVGGANAASSFCGEACWTGTLFVEEDVAAVFCGEACFSGNLTAAGILASTFCGEACFVGGIVGGANAAGDFCGEACWTAELFLAQDIAGAFCGETCFAGDITAAGVLASSFCGEACWTGDVSAISSLTATYCGEACWTADISTKAALTASFCGEACFTGLLSSLSGLQGQFCGEACFVGGLSALGYIQAGECFVWDDDEQWDDDDQWIDCVPGFCGEACWTGNLGADSDIAGVFCGEACFSGVTSPIVNLQGTFCGEACFSGALFVEDGVSATFCGEACFTGNLAAKANLSSAYCGEGCFTAAITATASMAAPFCGEACWTANLLDGQTLVGNFCGEACFTGDATSAVFRHGTFCGESCWVATSSQIMSVSGSFCSQACWNGSAQDGNALPPQPRVRRVSPRQETRRSPSLF